MTFHVITILSPRCRLSVDRGFLCCHYHDEPEQRIALADVRALVIGVPSVSFSNECLARLLAQDAPVLHCDAHFKPIGWTISLDRVIRQEVFENQLKRDKGFQEALWRRIIHQKMCNQAAVLEALGVEHDLNRLIEKPLANEANVARQYWHLYFEALGTAQRRERKGADSFENKALNYGYAVLSTLVHRAILVYGMLPSLGVHHEYRYRSTPLVYDLMEPLRGFVDLLLARWRKEYAGTGDSDNDFQNWIRFLMDGLRCCRIADAEKAYSYKLMDAVDTMVRSVAACFEEPGFSLRSFDKLWLPDVRHHYWHQASSSLSQALPEDE